jgi:ankyrin repeat protein
VRLPVEAGADPNARRGGEETPLHWAASSDDVHVATALIDAGADINAPGGSIGSPLANAVGYACWEVDRLLVSRGADVEQPWIAASLGLLDQLTQLLGVNPSSQQVSQAFWHACSGGQCRAAEYLLGRGADLSWVPDYARGTPLDAATGGGTQRENLIGWLRERGATTADADA